MNALICTCCGGKIVADVGGKYICEYCRMEYTEERVKEMIVSGVVETTVGSAEKERLLNNAKYFTEQGNFDDAEKTFKKLLFDFPNDESVKKSHIEYEIKYYLSEIDNDKRKFAYKRPKDVKKCFELINLAEKNGINNGVLKEKMHDLFTMITSGNNTSIIYESAVAYEKISTDNHDTKYKNFTLFKDYIIISNKIDTINRKLGYRQQLSDKRKKLDKNLKYMKKSLRWDIVGYISMAISGLLVVLTFVVHFILLLGLFITIPLISISDKLSGKNRMKTGYVGGGKKLMNLFLSELEEMNKKEIELNNEEKLMQNLMKELEELKKKYDNK